MDFRALLIGGLLPSLLLGTSTVLMKFSVRHGIALPLYLTVVGATVLVYGLIATFFSADRSINTVSGGYALAMGIAWATASLCMSYGLSAMKLPVSVVAPLSNSNALVAVLLSAVLLSEWKNLSMPKILLGTLLIVAGASIVSTAMKDS